MPSHDIAAMVRRELRKLVKERTLVLAVLVQFVGAGFAAFLLVGLSGLLAPDAAPPVPVVIAATGDDALAVAVERQGVTVLRTPSVEAAMEAVARGRADAALVADPPDGDGAVRVTVLSPADDVRGSFALARLRAALVAYEDELRRARGDRLVHDLAPLPPAAASTDTHLVLVTLLVPLLALLPAFLAGAALADSLTEERETGTVMVLRTLPSRPARLMAGKLAVHLSTPPLLALAWVALLAQNGIPIERPWLVVAVATAVGAVLVAIGGLLALGAKSRGHVQLLYTAAVAGLAAASTMLPRSPVNLIARAAAGTSGPGDVVLVAALAVAGVLGIALLLHPRIAAAWTETPA